MNSLLQGLIFGRKARLNKDKKEITYSELHFQMRHF